MTGTWDRERLLLGDWSSWCRDGLDLLRYLLVVAAGVALLQGVDSGSVVLAAAAAAGLAVRRLLLPRPYDLAVLLALALQGLGEASGAYDTVPWFDRVVHLAVPMLGSGVLYLALARLDVLPDPRDETGWRHHLGIGIVTAALGIAFGAVWELTEWASDGTLGSDLQEGNEDTVGDLAMDTLGALAAAVLLVLWTIRGWGSVRRVPGQRQEALE